MSFESIWVMAATATIVAQPLVDRDVLEPSVRNEVDHALAQCEKIVLPKGVRVVPLPFSTNGLSRTDLAIRLVSAQKADGHWRQGTNDYTVVARDILKGL